VQSATSGSTQLYLVDANNHTGYAQVLEEFTDSGSGPGLTRSYVIGDDVLAQCYGGAGSETDPAYLLYDGHGSTRQLLHTAATDLSAQYNYDAYGVTLGTSTGTPETSLLYCGEQFDEDLEMYNLRARFYDPNNGRFNAMDTFKGNNQDPQSLHKYLYAHCDPVNNVDPSGRFTLVELMPTMAIGIILMAILLVAYVKLAPPITRPRPITSPTIYWITGTGIATATSTGTTPAPKPRTLPAPLPLADILQERVDEEDEDLKNLYSHYSDDPPASFAGGLEANAYVVETAFSGGLDSNTAMIDLSISPPTHEYYFLIDRWTHLDPPDNNVPGRRKHVQFRVHTATGPGSLVGWREVEQTHPGRR
jgi:RHS repeat-associated protein